MGRPLLACLALLPCVACFEPTIDETIEIRFREDGKVELSATVQLPDPISVRSDGLRQRIGQRSRALLENRDDWTRRFAGLEPLSERSVWEREEGALRRFVRSAVLGDPQRDLRRFFADTELTVFYRASAATVELALHPGLAARADRRQRERVRRGLERFGAGVAEYLAAAESLYAYVDDNPQRARICLGALFGDLVAETVREDLEEPDEHESELVDALLTTMESVAEILDPEDDEPFSLDELSRLVHDPFPATITVVVPGPIVDAEGFEQPEGDRLRIRPLGLWSAFAALEGRWLTPDPLVAFVRAARVPGHATRAPSRRFEHESFDLDAFVGRPRRFERAPSASEVERALRRGLEPAATYRVVWQVPPG